MIKDTEKKKKVSFPEPRFFVNHVFFSMIFQPLVSGNRYFIRHDDFVQCVSIWLRMWDDIRQMRFKRTATCVHFLTCLSNINERNNSNGQDLT